MGEVKADAAANYNSAGDFFRVPSLDFGQTPFEQTGLVHEGFHAWRDLMGKKALTADGKYTATLGVTDEAMAYVAGVLFTVNQTTPPGKAPTPAWWEQDPDQFGIAHQIAKTLVNRREPVVSAQDSIRLRSAVLASGHYKWLVDDPNFEYANDGVSG